MTHGVVFGLYFLVVFGIGIYALRTTKTEADYWIAGGQLGWVTGGATLAATHASAGTFIGVIGVIYTTGWSFAWLVLSIPIAYWFTAAVLAPRFTRVKKLTLPAFLEARYASRAVRVAAAVIVLIATVVYMQAQIIAGGLIGATVFDVSRTTAMIVFTVVLLLYTAGGGMLAVVYTDLLQLGVMTLGVVLGAPIAVARCGGLDQMFRAVVETKPATFTWSGLPPSLLLTMGLAFTLGSIATPEKLVRLYAMKDMRTVRRGVLMAIIFATGLNLIIFFIGLAAIVLLPDLPTGDLAMPMMAKQILPPVIGAILLAAVTSAMMSTVDSLLLVAGSALSHDIVGTLRKRPLSGREKSWLNRVGIGVVGIAPLALILSGVGEGELIQFIVLLFTALMAAAFFAPVVIGIYWRRATAAGALASMLGGVIVTFCWKLWGLASIDPVLPGCLVSFALLAIVSINTKPPPDALLAPYFD